MNSTVQNIKPREHESAVDMTLHKLDTEFYGALFPLKLHTWQAFRSDAQFSVTKQTSENGAPFGSYLVLTQHSFKNSRLSYGSF